LKEITEGSLVKYRIVVKTGERLGSSTEAPIKLRLFGGLGKSKQIKLKDSKTHKIPFRRGNTDVFDLEVFDIGKIKAIHVGHQEKNIEFSWFVDYIGVEDQTHNIVYTFETPDWFSVTSGDKRTARILLTKNSTNLSDNESSSDEHGSSSATSASSSSSTRTLKSNPICIKQMHKGMHLFEAYMLGVSAASSLLSSIMNETVIYLVKHVSA
jgi:hypothetical protein